MRPAAAPASRDRLAAGSDVLYVARRGWHIDVGLAADQLGQLDYVALPGSSFVSLGFGDRHYLEGDRRWRGMLAAVWRGPALVLATGLTAAPEQAFGAGRVIQLRVSPRQLSAARDFIAGSIASPLKVADGPYPGSIYFAASLPYSGLHTCNTWAAEVLEHAGLPVHSRGVVFAGQLWTQAKNTARAQAVLLAAPAPGGR